MNKQSTKAIRVRLGLRDRCSVGMVKTFTESKGSVSLLSRTLKNYLGNIDTDVFLECNLRDTYCKKYKTIRDWHVKCAISRSIDK